MDTATNSQSKKTGVIIGGIILLIVIIGGSFLIGRSLGSSNQNNNNDDSSQTSQTAEPEQDISNDNPSTVFDSTEEEIDEVQEEQVQLDEENQERVEAAVEQAQITEPAFTLSRSFEIVSRNECNLTIIYTEDSEEPGLYKGALTLNGGLGEISQDSATVFCQDNDFLNRYGNGGISSVEKKEIENYFTPDSYERISFVGVSNHPNDVENNIRSYIIRADDFNTELVLRLRADTNFANNKIQIPLQTDKSVVTTETYTNQYFPDFRLVYPSDWEFETRTNSSSISAGLLSRNIRLTKNNRAINLYLSPEIIEPCVGLGPEGYTSPYDQYKIISELNNGVTAAISNTELGMEGGLFFKEVYFSPTIDPEDMKCPLFTVQTNIDNESFEVRDLDGKLQEGDIRYQMIVNSNLEEDDELLAEALAIIENSTLR